MAFLLFHAYPFINFPGAGSLPEHLSNIVNFGDKPRCWQIVEGTKEEAIATARQSKMYLYIVDDVNFHIVAAVNKPKREKSAN